MIFVEYKLSEWLEKYPNLEILKLECDSCGKELITDKPFIEKGYAGLMTDKCPCGKNRHTCQSKVTTSIESYNYWIKLTNSFI